MILAPPYPVIRVAYTELVTFLTKLGQTHPPRGTGVTSWYRDPQHNAAVGGSPSSQHLLGLAVDLVVPELELGAFVAELRRVGLVPVVERTHLHIQARPAGTSHVLLAALGVE